MDSDEAKLFIGGIEWDTTEDKLKEYFGNYGEVTHTAVFSDRITGRPRGFGFVVFADPSVLDTVLQDKHSIDGRTVEAKRVLPREEQRTYSRPGNPNAGRSFGGAGNYRTKKIFVGGLPSILTEKGFRQCFKSFGNITDVVIMYDQNTHRPRGFGFITFDTEDAVDRVLHKNFYDLNDKLVEVKPALPKEANPGGGGHGGYQPYGSGASASTFDTQMMAINLCSHELLLVLMLHILAMEDQIMDMEPQIPLLAMVGTVVMEVPILASLALQGHTKPSTPNTGYISAQAGALKSPESSQTPGYGASGYTGNAGYAPGSVGAVSAAMGPSPGRASGYGSLGYGYSNYGGSEGSYTNSGGYGTVGGHAGGAPNSNPSGSNIAGEQQGMGGGYMGSAYGNNSGSLGYSNAAWRSDS